MLKARYIIFFLFAIFCLTPAAGQAEMAKKNVLYLNSYHRGYKWSDDIFDGVRSVLEAGPYKIDLQIEYMDIKKYRYEDVTGMLLHLYMEKFRGERFDVVLVSDNDAFNFATYYREELFPGVPLVFCGVNALTPRDLEVGNLAGVVENFDLSLTLDVARRLHPDKRHMVVVGDASTAGLAIKRQIEDAVPRYEPQLVVDYWTHLSLPDVLERVRRLPPDTFLFFIPYYQTMGNNFYTAEEVMAAIYANSSVPIYTAWEFLIGHGAVGGRVLSGYQHGQAAAGMVLEILGGKSVDDIPVDHEYAGDFVFDYNVMDRLNLTEDMLPEGSRIINAPKAFYELPKELFWTIMVSFALLLVVTVFLIFAMLARRKVERKIKDQLAFQETLMDTVPQLLAWKDMNGRYLGVNRAFAEFFGYKDSAFVVSKTTREVIVDSEYATWAFNADQQAMRDPEAVRKVRRKLEDGAGNQGWLEISKVPIRDQSGRVVGLLSTAENITKEHNLEKQLLQSQKMEAIGTLAGGIAHDFNNILTSIINSTELALGDVEPDSVTRRDLERVLKAARRGGRVVKQILAFSRPSTEGFRSTDVGAVVSEALGFLEASMPSNIAVRSLVAPSLSCVLADPTQLHQVAMNLFTNAFHALREQGGVIEARVEQVLLDEDEAGVIGLNHGWHVRLTIEDNGPGIPPEIVDKIFDPFFSTKDKTEGTGLGLAVVHGIVRSHKGGLQVSPRIGGGTVFEVYLPRADEADAECQAPASDRARQGGHILFVEDDEDQLDATPRLLEVMGYQVTPVRSPESALALVRMSPCPFDLLITDYDMPGLSGTQLARRVGDLVPLLPVILVSGREDAAMAASDLPNIRQVVIKPYDKDDLATAIASALAVAG
ncbi:hybrid sensor histidine kinase/response regulator [Pseudodesulfovibrio aespoeensis]|uniref:hybrid sensor histidine kinase/response regulator n=1 Tax=Pseudodesulfovibrio aespoeensis TaxID=182210 RepID=UPI002354BA89|nr:ABC transporter substrate binding protein [Pseudodesulfovibrio aespoeensis]MCG2732840.1 ATP-binding protein [Pseudodesulfovibrio aespoeensis]